MRRLVLTALFAPALALAVAKVGAPAPDFSAGDVHRKNHTLSEFKGKFLVLEWYNEGCPFVRKYYESGTMQKLQKEWTAKGVAWVTVISSAPGKQGYATAGTYVAPKNDAATAVLLDPKGAMGRAYGAKTTPHMFVIDPKGTLVYDGAIDDKPGTDASDIPKAKNYVSAALEQARAGKPVATPVTEPYGCGIKYTD